jgi:hypothetical protein
VKIKQVQRRNGDITEICLVLFIESKKKKKNKNKGSKNQAAAQQKPEGLSPLEVFTASGFDMSQIADLDVSKLCIELNVHKFMF